MMKCQKGLLRRGYNVDVGVVESVEKNKEGKSVRKSREIDFVVNAGMKKLYIQSAYGMDDPGQVARETLPLMRTGDAFRRMIVTNGNGRPWTDENGVVRVGIIPFLLDARILASVVRG